jgi:formylglycine-generating enzyme required for sulfatase activity
MKAITQAELYKTLSKLIKSEEPSTQEAVSDLLHDLSPVGYVPLVKACTKYSKLKSYSETDLFIQIAISRVCGRSDHPLTEVKERFEPLEYPHLLDQLRALVTDLELYLMPDPSTIEGLSWRLWLDVCRALLKEVGSEDRSRLALILAGLSDELGQMVEVDMARLEREGPQVMARHLKALQRGGGFQCSATALKRVLRRLIKEARTAEARGALAKMLRELACIGYKPLIKVAESLESLCTKHTEVKSGLKKVCSKVSFEWGVSGEYDQPLEKDHLLNQLRELMMSLAFDRPLKELSEVDRLRRVLWSGAIMSWLDRVESAGESTTLSRERGLLLECSDQLGHLLKHDPYRFADEGINIVSERLQRMEHGGGEVNVVLPDESDVEGWEALRLSGLLSELWGVKRLTIDGFWRFNELELESVQCFEVDMKRLEREGAQAMARHLKALQLNVCELKALTNTPAEALSERDQVTLITSSGAERYEGGADLTELMRGREVKAGFAMIYCPAGEFWMGSEEGVGRDWERPRHHVKISKPFLMGQTQVTQALWEAVMGANPSRFKGWQRPVERVSWYDMARFCNALSELEGFRPAYSIGSGDRPDISLDFSANGYRMPTEAEWEYAAKAGTEQTYAGSDQLSEVGWFDENSDGETHPVAQKNPNTWGLHDMSGNVWEWCSDKWDSEAYKSRLEVSIDPCVYASSPAWRVLRGGCWNDDAGDCRVALRNGFVAGDRWNDLGGRLLRWNLDT